MRLIVVGYGIQGKKRAQVAGPECVATVDAYQEGATYRTVHDVPLDSYDAACICTPDGAKLEILHDLLKQGKHLLVEKPLLAEKSSALHELLALARSNDVVCYTAYNHRFEPHFVRMKALLAQKTLGTLYHCRLFYGNGTARDVRNSPWRDQGSGVLKDLGSHLLDTLLFWFGAQDFVFDFVKASRFENQSPDHVLLSGRSPFSIDLEMSLVSWRNHFSRDLIGERGSAHIDSLCKWGPSRFTERRRVLPSGRPSEESWTLVQPDPTWQLEYAHFKTLMQRPTSNLSNDIWIQNALERIHPSLCLGASV